MNTERYAMWVQSHRVEVGEFDITDSVMNQILQKSGRPDIFRQVWELFLLDFIQMNTWLRAGMLATGALAGLIRMIFVLYCGLFT